MNAREELEKIIKEILSYHIKTEYDNETFEHIVKELTNAILSKFPELGYVRLENVEINKERLAIALYKGHAGEEYYKKVPWEKLLPFEKATWLRYADAITNAKEILRVKK